VEGEGRRVWREEAYGTEVVVCGIMVVPPHRTKRKIQRAFKDNVRVEKKQKEGKDMVESVCVCVCVT
jgi:hypothetical protein